VLPQHKRLPHRVCTMPQPWSASATLPHHLCLIADCSLPFVPGTQNLDFDFEKCCSVSLSPVNVYACLVCGKYFQGRGPKTHAYTHALEVGHQMFMKLADGKVRSFLDFVLSYHLVVWLVGRHNRVRVSKMHARWYADTGCQLYRWKLLRRWQPQAQSMLWCCRRSTSPDGLGRWLASQTTLCLGYCVLETPTLRLGLCRCTACPRGMRWRSARSTTSATCSIPPSRRRRFRASTRCGDAMKAVKAVNEPAFKAQ